jgi:hypothetical protein
MIILSIAQRWISPPVGERLALSSGGGGRPALVTPGAVDARSRHCRGRSSSSSTIFANSSTTTFTTTSTTAAAATPFGIVYCPNALSSFSFLLCPAAKYSRLAMTGHAKSNASLRSFNWCRMESAVSVEVQHGAHRLGEYTWKVSLSILFFFLC